MTKHENDQKALKDYDNEVYNQDVSDELNPMETALDRFVELTSKNSDMIEKLKSHIENHMDTNPDEINWANVGDAGHVNEELTNIINFLGLAE